MKSLITLTDLHEIPDVAIFRLTHISYISKLYRRKRPDGSITIYFTIIVMMNKIPITLVTIDKNRTNSQKETSARDEYNKLIIAFKNSKSLL